MKTLLVLAVFMLVISCKKDNDLSSGSLPLNADNFIMKVDRHVVTINVTFPSDELQESNYIQTDVDKQYEIKFSENYKSVTIINRDFSHTGELKKIDGNLNHYDLVKGTFAGGRFNVWTVDNHFEAELTIYGSGMPIIGSERGVLIPVE